MRLANFRCIIFIPAAVLCAVSVSAQQTLPVSTILVDKDPALIDVLPGADVAFALSKTDRSLYVLGLSDYLVTGRLELSEKPVGLAINPADSRILVTASKNSNKSYLYVIGPDYQPVQTVTIAGDAQGIAINPDDNTAIIALKKDKKLLMISTETYQVTGEISLPHRPVAVAFDRESQKALVIACKASGEGRQNIILIVDLAAGNVLHEIEMAKEVSGIATDGEKGIAVASAGQNTYVIDIASGAILSTIQTEHATGVSINPLTHTAVISVLDGIILLDLDAVSTSYYSLGETMGSLVTDYLKNTVLAGGNKKVIEMQLPFPVPVVNSISPDVLLRGISNQVLTVNGENFIETAVALLRTGIASHQITPVFIDQNHIQVPVPDELLVETGSLDLIITNDSLGRDAGASSLPHTLQVVNPVPAISSLLPLDIMAGIQSLKLDIYGSSLFNDTSFYINDSQKAFTFESRTKAHIDLSASDMEYGRYLGIRAFNQTPGGGYSQPARLTVLNPVPALTSLYPNETEANTPLTMTINGSGFVKTSDVRLSGQSKPFVYQGWTGLKVDIPAASIANAGYYQVEVNNPAPGGGTSNLLNLTVKNPLPVLNALNPSLVIPSTDVTVNLTGSGFVPSSTVSVDGTSFVTSYLNSNEMTILLSSTLASPGSHSIRIINPPPGGGISSPLTLTAEDPVPPDPETQAPPVDETVVTTMLSSTDFLYTSADPIQKGVAPGTMELTRAAVIRGKVTGRDGSALSGVGITISGHPEFGYTISREGGGFDMAVNGGSTLVVQYNKPGYLPVQRTVDVPWQDYALAPNVVMIQLDAAASSIDLSSAAPIQTAMGSPVSDESGSRQAVLLFNQGTTAAMTFADGSTQPLSNLTVRATEYTVGPNGPKAMPAPMPANVAYTYAVEFSADEAIAAGAKSVQFSRPVINYVDNFLHFDIGIPVPTAYYDANLSAWIPSTDGRVVEILAISNGVADLDIDGSGTAASTDDLAALGVTEAELQQLASMYQAGRSFWRVPIPHFTPWDHNWAFGPPADATGPDQPPPDPDIQPNPNVCKGCVIEVQNQTLGETAEIAGTPFSLNYRSSRVPSRKAGYSLRIPLSGASVPASLKRIELEVYVAGRVFINSFGPASNQIYTFTWDGKDAYGRILQGRQPVTIKIGYTYQGVYRSFASSGGSGGNGSLFVSFGSYPRGTITGDLTRQEVTIWQTIQSEFKVGLWNAQAQGFGGWTLSSLHVYDSVGRVLHLGDGGELSVDGMNDSIETIAGSGTAGFSGDGGPAVQGRLNNPAGVATDASGNVYIADQINNRIRKIDANGVISTIAGNGQTGFSGDGGPASQAVLNRPSAVVLDRSGNVYIADQMNNRIRKIEANGIISTIAGNGLAGFGGDYGPAAEALLNRPSGVASDTAGNIYIADSYNNRVRKIAPGGIISTIAGNGQPGYSGDGGFAADAGLNRPSGVAVTAQGNIYIADQLNNRIRKIDISGVITTVAGNGDACSTSGCDIGDGRSALEASLYAPAGIAVDGRGNIFIADTNHSRIRKVDPTGGITTFAGMGQAGYSGDGGPAAQAGLNYPAGIAAGPSGKVYIADTKNNRVREIKILLPGVSASDIVIPSEDGRELYAFNSSGRHLQTLDALTGAVIYSFIYDAGRLTQVKDGYGNITSISRDGSSTIYIKAPGGQRTTLSVDANGWLSAITDPAGHAMQPVHALDGLLTSFTDRKGNTNYFTYDAMGRLVRDDDAVEGSKMLSRTDISKGFTVELTTAMGLTSSYKVEDFMGTIRRTDTVPQSGQYVTVTKPDGTSEETSPDGMVTSITTGPDPRFGMFSPVITGLNIATPGGLQLSLAGTSAADLADPADPFSFTILTDSFSVNGKIFTRTYNAASRTITVTTPTGRQKTITLNNKGKVVSSHVAGLNAVSFGYDSMGRLDTITQGTGSEARNYTINYNSQNHVSDIIDPMSKNVSFTYDLAGRVTQETLPDGRVINYAYDANGNVTSIVPPGKPAHEFDYTPVDLTKDYMPPDVGAESKNTTYSYDFDRRLTEVTRPAGYTLPYSEDLHSTFTYDGSLLTSVAWSGAVNGSVWFAYNKDFNIASETVNSADAVEFAYDNDGLLAGAGTLSINRDPNNGLILGSTLGNVTDTWTYNGFGEPETYSASYGGSQVISVQYTRDKLGRITHKTETVSGVTHVYGYGYDEAGRLTDVEEDGLPLSHYEYDLNGNRLSYNGITAAYDNQDRMIAYGDYAYAYTDNGELAGKSGLTGTTQYGYDAFGNLITVIRSDGTNIEYVVDGQNRRVGKKVNGVLIQGFLYEDQLRPVAELDSVGNIESRFVYGTGVNVPDYMIKHGLTYRIITDHLGSPRLVIDVSTGQITQRIDYDEYGNIIYDSNPGFQPFGFAGGIYDHDTNLTRFGARDYDAATGKWTAKDPILFAGGDANLFGYVFNNPLRFVDPLGLAGCGPGSGLGNVLVPELNFGPCCDEHDKCYGDKCTSKWQCDLKFCACVLFKNMEISSLSPLNAITYCTSVTLFGFDAYNSARH